ncbi:hypothetical protein [Sphingomonas guangdongensis]|uniref:hypothetical protein n=1 Tax=Sphingomonas guangdongensis TaxID=1141890 RepID=UPI00118192CF|nr:hypothetical protein [Sphingomonas guangdongensis]
MFSDTKAYYALGQGAVGGLLPHRPSAEMDETIVSLRGRSMTAAETRAETRLAYTVAASRSPYWSGLFYLAVELGTAWLVVALQALTAAATVWVAARAFGVAHAYLPIVAVLALATSLPVTVMFLMPDLFAGLAIVAAGALVGRRVAITRAEMAISLSVMAAGALFHTSHMLLLAALGGGTAVIAGLVRRYRKLFVPALAVFSAAIVGVAGAIAFPVAVQIIRGEPVYAPPFLSARLIADGPGRALLRQTCQRGDEWGWCAYRDRPLRDVNVILWDSDPTVATFQAADYHLRVRMIREQPRFVLAVLSRYPGQVAANTVRNVANLFLQYGTDEMLGDPSDRFQDPEFRIFKSIVPGTQDCAAGTASCASRLDLVTLDRVIGTVLFTSWLALAVLLASPVAREQWGRAITVLLAGIALNAIICGAISGNAQRYQARLTWLVPFFALAIGADVLRRRRTAGRDQASLPVIYPAN